MYVQILTQVLACYIYHKTELPSSKEQQNPKLLPSSAGAKDVFEIVMSGIISLNTYCIQARTYFCGHIMQARCKNQIFHILLIFSPVNHQ